ncbi:MAG: ABC transporter permease [Kofleriaceae bacterium]|nr:ABC transporter permease [Kofleriaceae bacterium]MCB9573524.1 ABC transporter permease [Kofleriaceae bacterium]
MGVVVLWAVATVAFFALHAAPGGPFDDERAVPPEVMRNIEERYHLDQPIFTQYLHYLGDVVRLDFGHSMKRQQTVAEIIRHHAPYSAKLGLFALAIAISLGVLLGVLAAHRQNRLADHAAMTVSLIGISVPSFVMGPLLVMIFALGLFWLPPARIEGFTSYILPATTLGLIYMGTIARLTRSGMLETLRQDYIRTARAKGVSERGVVWRHGLRLGLLPVVTYLGPATAGLISGSFVIEKIFQVPGLGYSFVASITDRDYPVLTGVLVFYAAFLTALNLVVDIVYGVLDPRIRDRR